MYIYIFEDGTVQKHEEGPTLTDLACVADGTLIVLRCDGVKYVDDDGQEDDLDDCKVVEHAGFRFHEQV